MQFSIPAIRRPSLMIAKTALATETMAVGKLGADAIRPKIGYFINEISRVPTNFER